jgi:hypothetical protein
MFEWLIMARNKMMSIEYIVVIVTFIAILFTGSYIFNDRFLYFSICLYCIVLLLLFFCTYAFFGSFVVILFVNIFIMKFITGIEFGMLIGVLSSFVIVYTNLPAVTSSSLLLRYINLMCTYLIHATIDFHITNVNYLRNH